jgi:hypothetical protein
MDFMRILQAQRDHVPPSSERQAQESSDVAPDVVPSREGPASPMNNQTLPQTGSHLFWVAEGSMRQIDQNDPYGLPPPPYRALAATANKAGEGRSFEVSTRDTAAEGEKRLDGVSLQSLHVNTAPARLSASSNRPRSDGFIEDSRGARGLDEASLGAKGDSVRNSERTGRTVAAGELLPEKDAQKRATSAIVAAAGTEAIAPPVFNDDLPVVQPVPGAARKDPERRAVVPPPAPVSAPPSEMAELPMNDAIEYQRTSPTALAEWSATQPQDGRSGSSFHVEVVVRQGATEGSSAKLEMPVNNHTQPPVVAMTERTVREGSLSDAAFQSSLADEPPASTIPWTTLETGYTRERAQGRAEQSSPMHAVPDQTVLPTSKPAGGALYVLQLQGGSSVHDEPVMNTDLGWSEESEAAIPSVHSPDTTILRKGLEIAASAGATHTTEPARNVAIQLAAAVSGRADGTFEIQLAPEELGRVTLTLQVTEDAVVLAIHAERQDTLDLMRRHADILQREFSDAGFSSLTFSFGHSAQDDRSPNTRTESVPDDDGGPGPSADRPLPEIGQRLASSRLDVRL